MEAANTQERWVINKTTDEIYRVVWIINGAVLLENDDSVQVLTTISKLMRHYALIEPLEFLAFA